MQCPKCGKDHPSRHYFVTEVICRECFDRLDESAQETVLRDIENLTSEGAGPRRVDGYDLSCPICGNSNFRKRQTLLNTPGLTFLGVEWANKKADNYVCDSCGHILWFLRERVTS